MVESRAEPFVVWQAPNYLEVRLGADLTIQTPSSMLVLTSFPPLNLSQFLQWFLDLDSEHKNEVDYGRYSS